VCARFDREQYQLHMKQLDNLKQTGSATDYYTKFEQLAHCILLYNNAYDDVYFVTRFLGGLKEEIRAPIALHRPDNMDTANALALLQEEEVEAARRKPTVKTEHKDFSKSGSWGFSTSEKTKASYKQEDSKAGDKSASHEKWAALKAYRKAHNLCYICGEKWTGHNHKCPDQVPLHMIQELLEMFQLEDCSDCDGEPYDSADEIIMALKADQSGSVIKKKRRTMRFRGFIGK
jgi:hypothetical protein